MRLSACPNIISYYASYEVVLQFPTVELALFMHYSYALKHDV